MRGREMPNKRPQQTVVYGSTLVHPPAADPQPR